MTVTYKELQFVLKTEPFIFILYFLKKKKKRNKENVKAQIEVLVF